MIRRSLPSSSFSPAQAPTIVDVLKRRCDRQPDDAAFLFLADGEDDEQPLSYAELDRRARAIAAALVDAGAPGSRALLVYDSGLDYIAALYGCLYAGVVAVPVYPPDPFRVDRTLPRLRAIVHDAGAAWLLATQATLDWARPLFRHVAGLASSLATDRITRGTHAQQADAALLSLDRRQPALLQYTSGSTGEPRGVTITHANLMANLASIHATLDRGDNVLVMWLPAYHDMGLIGGIFQPVYSGRRNVLMSPVSFMQRPVRWLSAISRYRGTITAAPNFAYDICVRKVTAEDRAQLDLSSLRFALNGAEVVRPETLDRFAETFAECGFRRQSFYPCYGLAEATLMVSGGTETEVPVVRSFSAAALEGNRAIVAHAENGERRIVGCGQPVLGQQIAIVDPESRQPLDEGQVGEIWVAGESVGQGYWNRPQETDASFAAVLAGEGQGRFLRTGDLGFIDRGELFVAGRLKEMIVIHGRNHYPNDIEETVCRLHPLLKSDGGAAFAVEVGGQERLAIVQEVVRPRKVDARALVDRIRAQVAEVHGVAPAAVVLIPAGTLGKTSSGKKQRRGCRDQFLSGSLPVVAEWRDDVLRSPDATSRAPAVAPRNETERKLADLWAEVLAIEVLDVHANFFDLGGQSLLAGQLAVRIQETFAAELPLRTLFSHPTVARLSAWLDQPDEERAGDVLPPVTCADRSQPLPLSSSQEQLWFLEQLDDEPRYNLSASIRLRGTLDVAALRGSLATVATRHESLRTRFPACDGRPRQVIAERHEPALQVAGSGAAETSQASRKFDLASGPLLRTSLVESSDVEHRLAIVAHHLICDGWSLAIFLRELAELYAAEVAGRPAALDDVVWQYADFAVWQQSCLATPAVASQIEHWADRLHGVQPLDLATDRIRVAEGKFRGAAVSWTVPGRQSDALRELGRGAGATLYMVLLAAFQTWLARCARQHDVCVGSPVSYRPRREFEKTIGYFVQMLALRSDLSGEPTFRELLAQVRETVLDALSRQDAPLRAVVNAVSPAREAGRSPLFNVVFVFENLPWHAVEAAGLSLGEIEIDHTHIGSFDLGLVVEEQSSGLKASLIYNAELFEAETVRHIAAAFQRLLSEIVSDPDRPITRLPLVDEQPQRREMRSARPATELRVDQLVHQQAERSPTATAVIDGERRLSYAEVDRRANQLAHYLQTLGVREEVPVALFLDRSVELVIAMLAVMKAGGAYVPFDPHESSARLQQMLADAQPRAVLTSSELAKKLPPHEAEEIVLAALLSKHSGPQLEGYPTTVPDHRATADTLAYIIYTSGSTGQPKGVDVAHGSLANLALAMADQYELTADDRVLQIISPAFDVAAEEIFPTLLRGASLVLGPPTAELTGRAILDVCRRQRISVAHIPPQLWQQCLLEWQTADDDIFEHLRVQVIGGEDPQSDALNRWLRRSRGRTRLLHEFGLTETTVTNLVYEIPASLDAWPADRKLPIGRPIAAAEVHVLDDCLQAVPVGAPGELYLGGPVLARGYHGRPDLTQERFVEHTFRDGPGARLYRTGDLVRWRPDGNLEFLGRVDQQLKLRGLRIEPGEIERVLTQHPDVGQAAVIARDDAPAGKRLVAYLVPANGQLPPSDELQTWLRSRLPDSMVPAAFVPLAQLPLNRSHKLDRDALPAPVRDRAARAYAPPRNEIEKVLAGIWQDTLRLDRVGIHDNFFELGGDSILTIQVVSQAREAGLRFAPRQIFEHQTIAELAAVEGLETAAEQGPIEGEAPLTPIQHWFLSDDVVDPHYFNQAVLLDVAPTFDARFLPGVFERLVEQHDALRLRFARAPEGWRQWHGEREGAWPLSRFDLSPLAGPAQPPVLTSAAADLQASLDLERGPLARAAWFDLGGGQARLLLIVHHLVTDAVSWRFLLDDLAMAWTDLQSGNPPILPAKTTSFKHWAERLTGYAETFELQNEAAFWRAFADRPSAPLPRDFEGDGTHADADCIVSQCDAAQTAELVERANAAYRTKTNELLLAALGQTLGRWALGDVPIDVEAHGREGLFDDVDLSRTVGWFTAWHPFALPCSDLPPGALLRQTKESLRRVADHGLGFGALRYLSPHAEIGRLMAGLPRPEVSFNYLGRMDDYLPATGLAKAEEPIGPLRSQRAPRRHLLEVNAYLLQGRLRIEWTYSRARHRRETIERLAADFLARLDALIAHCLSPEAGGFTPSDFPLARMSESELDKLAKLLGGAE